MPRRRGPRPRLLAAVVPSKATSAFAAERQVVSRTQMTSVLTAILALLVTVAGSNSHKNAVAADTGRTKHGGSVSIRARRSTVVVFAPASWATDAKTDPGTVEMVAHVSFAVGDLKRCKGVTPIDIRMVFADRLEVNISGRHDDIDLARRFPDSAGAVLLRPGKKICAFATPHDTAFLGDLLTHAAGKFFDVATCLQQGMSDPCGVGGG